MCKVLDSLLPDLLSRLKRICLDSNEKCDKIVKMAFVSMPACVHGRALCLECGVSWVRVPPETAHFSFKKCLPWVCLCYFACFFLLPSFFISHYHVHTRRNILTLVYNVLKVMMQINSKLFDELSNSYKADKQRYMCVHV